jgi:ferredoxin--NADP+ reductase
MIGLTTSSRVVLSTADHERVRVDLADCADALTRHKLELLSTLGTDEEPADSPRIRLAYRLTPRRVLGDDRATGIEFTVTGTEQRRRLDAGLVLSSIGYRGRPLPGLPFDEGAAVVPNQQGRVVDPHTGAAIPGCYVAGWIKRGPTGFIGTNKSCAQETVNALVDDYNDGLLSAPEADLVALDKLVRNRRPERVDRAGWWMIDRAEIDRGQADGRPRDKFATVGEMLAAAVDGEQQPRRRLLAGIAGIRRS